MEIKLDKAEREQLQASIDSVQVLVDACKQIAPDLGA